MTIRAGIVGANASRGWALVAHLPALRAVEDIEISAVSSRDPARAEAAAAAFGAPCWFDNSQALITAPNVDLIIVTVKVADHRDIVMAALDAGKMVFSEWPLGRDLAEAQAMAALARSRGLRSAIGLQTRFSPQIRYVRQLVADGYFGTILGTSMVGSAGVFNGRVEAANDYIMDSSSGASLLSIPAGHAVDVLCHVLGEFRDVSATFVNRHPHYVREEDGAMLSTDTPDQIAFSGTLDSGALASVHYRGGLSKGPDFHWEINGTLGDAILTKERGRLSDTGLVLRASQGGAPLEEMIPPPAYAVPAAASHIPHGANVAALYAQFARDVRDGTHIAPDFDDAVQRHRLLDAIMRAAATGIRQTV